MVQPGDVPWRRAAADRGYEPQRRAFTGTLGIIDGPRFLNAVGPLIAERSGDAFRLLPASEGEGGVLEADSGSVRLENRGQLTALVFGGHTEEAGALPDFPPALREQLDRALPLPLLWYGYNYVCPIGRAISRHRNGGLLQRTRSGTRLTLCQNP